jgi:hypothetical protein
MRRRVDSDLAELARTNPTLFLQMRVSRMLGFGFALTFAWSGGICSLVALFIGLRARRLIREGGGRVVGTKMALWCVVAGAVGTLVGLLFWVWLFTQAAKNR